MKSLLEIQLEIKYWADREFGPNKSKDKTSKLHDQPLESLPPLLGMIEELGELARAVGRRHQGRGYQDDREFREAKEDALADLLVFMCDYANREGIDLTRVLNSVWAKVSGRRQATWAQDKAKEVTVKVELHDFSGQDGPLKQCIKCGDFYGLIKERTGGIDPEREVCLNTRPFDGKTEPCCECGADYPRVDLIRGHVYCEKCRKAEEERTTKKQVYQDGHGFGHADQGEYQSKGDDEIYHGGE